MQPKLEVVTRSYFSSCVKVLNTCSKMHKVSKKWMCLAVYMGYYMCLRLFSCRGWGWGLQQLSSRQYFFLCAPSYKNCLPPRHLKHCGTESWAQCFQFRAVSMLVCHGKTSITLIGAVTCLLWPENFALIRTSVRIWFKDFRHRVSVCVEDTLKTFMWLSRLTSVCGVLW